MTDETLESVLADLIEGGHERRAAVGWQGLRHVERWHSERAVVAQTLEVYERAGLRIAA